MILNADFPLEVLNLLFQMEMPDLRINQLWNISLLDAYMKTLKM